MNKKNRWIPFFFFAVLLWVIYGDSLNGDFISAWDDGAQVLSNSDIHNLDWEAIKNIFTSYYIGSYQPLASFSFALEYELFGANSRVFHATNLILAFHNLMLLFYILQQWFPKRIGLVWFVSVVFAVQPFQVEVIAWISTRSTLLGYAFLLWAIFYYNKMCYKGGRKFTLERYATVFVFFVLACFSKSSTIVFAPFLFVIEYLYEIRVGYRKIVEKVPFFLVAIIFGIVSLYSGWVDLTLCNFYDYYNWYQHLLINGKTLFFYMVEWLYTDTLHIVRPFPVLSEEGLFLGMPFAYYWQSALVVVLLGLLMLWLYKTSRSAFKKPVVFGLALFFIFIGLNLNFLAVSSNMIAERYNYIPSVGIAIIVYIILFETDYVRPFRMFIVMGLLVCLGRFAIVSKSQVRLWASAKTLFEKDAKFSESGYSPNQLGKIYEAEGDFTLAMEYFNIAVKKEPANCEFLLNRGDLRVKIQDKAKAIRDFVYVLKLHKTKEGEQLKQDKKCSSKAYLGLGMVYETIDKDLAITYYDSAITVGNEVAFFRKDKLLKNEGKEILLEKTILDKASEALSKKQFKNLKLYAAILQEIPESHALGTKYMIHAQVGLCELEEALNSSLSLLKMADKDEQLDVLSFINTINVKLKPKE